MEMESSSLLSPLLFLLFSYHIVYPERLVDAADTLAQGQSIRDDGRPLVSAGEVFALGFFSPGNSTNRYVGIWYYKVPGNAVVWVANRDRPIRDSSGTFTLGRDGNLVVSDMANATLWSSNATSGISSNTSAQLLDTGDFVVVNASGGILWQMFDYPADTFLPGMRWDLDLRTRTITRWTSWTSTDDPAPGRYSSGFDPRGLAQLFLWDRDGKATRPRWRSGQWNGQAFTGVYNAKPMNLYGFKYTTDDERKKVYFSYTVNSAVATYVRMVITHDGKAFQYSWKDGGSGEWEVFWEQPLRECDVYNRCGPNAMCDVGDDKGPRCGCLRGFKPKVEQEWNVGDWSGGCIRKTELGCRSNGSGGGSDGFWRLERLKLPDRSEWAEGVEDGDGCREVCGRNCSCVAYTYVNGVGCMVWGVDLVDVRSFPSGGGSDVNLKVPVSELPDDRRKKSKIFVLGIILGSIFIILFILGLWKFKSKCKGIWSNDGQAASIIDMNMNEEDMEGTVADFPLFTFEAIIAATNDFSLSNMLGKGGFGLVYKGKFKGGQEIAVKRLSRDSGQGMEEFKNEMILISKLQHRNLVRLLGCCIEGNEKILVYEYMPNKSLDLFLFDSRNRELLDWNTRFNIINGIARGLLYLHHDSRLRIVHRDLKASNILLDEDMQPKISDFGMARIFEYNQNQANTNRVVGTYGYMSPEYAMDGLYYVKSDVYSFGVLLLEIISSRKNQITLDYEHPSNNLLHYAWQMWIQGKPMDILDPLIKSSGNHEEVQRCMQIGLLCIQDRPTDRPTMSSIVLMLGSECSGYPTPKQPTFATTRSTSGFESSSSSNINGFSSTNVTITVISGR